MTPRPETVESDRTAAEAAKPMKKADAGDDPGRGETLIGVVAQAHVARAADERRVGETVEQISR
jgi:hypothetical protein